MGPFLHRARATGDRSWVEAAKRLYTWTERVLTQGDGSVLNDIDSSWDGITTFYAIQLADCLRGYRDVLDEQTTQAWEARLRRAAEFLMGYEALHENNVNYTISCALALWLAGDVTGARAYQEHAANLVTCVYGLFEASGLLYGEGVPRTAVTPQGCRPVDIGYNVEESLPLLLRYGQLAGDERAIDLARRSFAAHLDFLLPDGGWDNSFGTRKFKWTYWGSRTTDGALAALLELSERPDDAFALVARVQLDALAACTHDGLLAGGPHYAAAGQPACVHHTFEHTKVLAEVLERGLDAKLPPAGAVDAAAVQRLPRLAQQGFRHYPELRTWIGSFGPVSATVSAYDFEYLPGGHTSGGTLSLLHHAELGPLLCASVSEYVRRERNNMQVPYRVRHECLALRVETRVDGRVLSSVYEDAPGVHVLEQGEVAIVKVAGELKDIGHTAVDAVHADSAVGAGNAAGAGDAAGMGNAASEVSAAGAGSGGMVYRMRYTFSSGGLELAVELPHGATLIVPLVSEQGERVTQGVDEDGSPVVRIDKAAGSVTLAVGAGEPLLPYGEERIFNLVPGLQALCIDVVPHNGRVRLSLSW